jgi:replication factor C small subunit
MDYRENEFLWVEKYRPRKLEDCILPASQKTIFLEMLAKG